MVPVPSLGAFPPHWGTCTCFWDLTLYSTDIGAGLEDGPGSLELGGLTLLPGWAPNTPLVCLLQNKPAMGQGRTVAEVSGLLGTQCHVSSAEEWPLGPLGCNEAGTSGQLDFSAWGLVCGQGESDSEGASPDLGHLPGAANRTRWSWGETQRGSWTSELYRSSEAEEDHLAGRCFRIYCLETLHLSVSMCVAVSPAAEVGGGGWQQGGSSGAGKEESVTLTFECEVSPFVQVTTLGFPTLSDWGEERRKAEKLRE